MKKGAHFWLPYSLIRFNYARIRRLNFAFGRLEPARAGERVAAGAAYHLALQLQDALHQLQPRHQPRAGHADQASGDEEQPRERGPAEKTGGCV